MDPKVSEISLSVMDCILLRQLLSASTAADPTFAIGLVGSDSRIDWSLLLSIEVVLLVGVVLDQQLGIGQLRSLMLESVSSAIQQHRALGDCISVTERRIEDSESSDHRAPDTSLDPVTSKGSLPLIEIISIVSLRHDQISRVADFSTDHETV
jgi:hypothetical protein